MTLPRPSRLAALPVWPIGRGKPPEGRFLAVVPGEAAPLLPVGLPAGLRGPARLAVARRQLADRLGPAAAGLDLRPAALAEDGGAGWGALLAVDRAALEGWRAALGRSGAAGRAQVLLPDYLALPAAPGLWVLDLDAGAPGGPRLLARLGPADGFAAEWPLAAPLLAQARARGPEPRAVLLRGGPLPEALNAVLDGLRLLGPGQPLPAGLPAPQAMARGEAGLDLRRDAGHEAGPLAARLRALILPAALALAGAGGWLAALAVETAALIARAAALAAATEDRARQVLGPGVPLVDIRLQLLRELDRRRDGATERGPETGLALVHRAAVALAEAGVQPVSLALAPDGRIEVDLVLPGFAALDRLAEGLRAAGLAVEMTRSASIGGGQVGAAALLSPGSGP